MTITGTAIHLITSNTSNQQSKMKLMIEQIMHDP